MSQSSPWGRIQHTQHIMPGWRSVSTAGHGGYMLTKRFAEDHLCPAAIRRAHRFLNWLCYEEDCDWAIVAWELPRYWDRVFAESSQKYRDNPEVQRAYLLQSLSRWHPDYLIAKGVEPDPEGLARWQDQEDFNRMRGERHPDLIISAVGSHYPSVPEGAVQVTTADHKRHFVDGEHYHEYCTTKGSMKLLLSECKPFDAPWDPAILAACKQS